MNAATALAAQKTSAYNYAKADADKKAIASTAADKLSGEKTHDLTTAIATETSVNAANDHAVKIAKEKESDSKKKHAALVDVANKAKDDADEA